MWFSHLLLSFLNQKISFLMFDFFLIFFGMNILMVWFKKKKKEGNKTFIRVYINTWTGNDNFVHKPNRAEPILAHFLNVGALSIASSHADFRGIINEPGPQAQLNRPFGPKLHEPRTFLFLLIFMSCTSIDKKP